MAVLSRDEFIARLQARVGEGTTDEDIAFLEDFTDTYNDLESKGSADWESKYNALDADWRKRYKERFFDGPSSAENSNPDPIGETGEIVNIAGDAEIVEEEKELTIDDLFDYVEEG